MKRTTLLHALSVFSLVFFGSLAKADFPVDPSFDAGFIFDTQTEGLTGDNSGNLYTAGRAGSMGLDSTVCPVWRINVPAGTVSLVGTLPNPCRPSGLAFDRNGPLFVVDGTNNVIFRLNNPNSNSTPSANVFATGVAGANAVAIDKDGNVWTGDGTTGQGRVWKITGPNASCSPASLSKCQEIFRVQPMANEVNLNAGVGGIGRDVRALGPGTITVTPTSRNAANTAGSQPLVANGLAFNLDGDLLVADTARGTIWKVKFNSDGTLASQTGCDTTFTSNTLCLNNIFVTHPIIEGADGIALDQAGNIWVAANERNAIAVIAADGKVDEIFRNQPDDTTKLRNTGPMEFPTSPFLLGNRFCTSHTDGGRRDNFPNSPGVVPASGGKVNCMIETLQIPGLPLPVQ
ncbi:MAG: SMP-30/gluconolactonase/LRE family protein [Candidatus Binatia bacterium]